MSIAQAILMNRGARHVTWIAVSGSLEGSGNNETLAGMVMKQSAIFIDDGDVHRLGWIQMIESKVIDFCKAQADPSSSKRRWVW